MFWPARLAVFYPYPQSIPVWQAAAAVAVVLTVSGLTIWAWRKRPYLAVGWFWYLGTLVPVIGLVQVGNQAHADRYMYIPMVGLLVMLAWGVADVVKKWPRTKHAIAAAGVIWCAVCLALARKETAYWQNSETLFQRAIEVTQDNRLAENLLGIYLSTNGRYAAAIPHFETVLRIKPDDAQAHNNLVASLASVGGCATAIPHFEAATRALTVPAGANYNLGRCQLTSGDYAAAITAFEAAIRADPDSAAAHFGLAVSLSKIPGRAPDAVRQYEAALRLTPADGRMHGSFGQLLASLGRTEEAIAHLETAEQIHLDPEISEVLVRLRAGKK